MPRQLRWDLSDYPDHVLETAKRLEIRWYLEDHEPDGNHRGRTRGPFEYTGIVVFDDIRLESSTAQDEVRDRHRKKRELHRDHGMIVDRQFETRQQGYEEGTLVFADGFEIQFVFEVVDDGLFEYTLGDETFEIEGATA